MPISQELVISVNSLSGIWERDIMFVFLLWILHEWLCPARRMQGREIFKKLIKQKKGNKREEMKWWIKKPFKRWRRKEYNSSLLWMTFFPFIYPIYNCVNHNRNSFWIICWTLHSCSRNSIGVCSLYKNIEMCKTHFRRYEVNSQFLTKLIIFSVFLDYRRSIWATLIAS